MGQPGEGGRGRTARVRVFGEAGVVVDDATVGIGGVRQRRLLALLAIRAGQVVSVDWLAEHLWTDGDRPANTVPAIRTYVSRLRSSLPEDVRDWVATAPAGYRLEAPAEAVEHLRFRHLRAEAARATRDSDPQAALRALDEALGLWTGDPFRELEDVAVVRPEIEQLQVERLETLEERWRASLALGRHTQVVGELGAFTAEHGLRDRAVRQHALALHRSGRTADALAAIAEHRRLLAEETGLDPSPAVAELEERLFAGDSSLDVAAVGRPLRGYRLLEESGRGAFSVVWRGHQPSVDREVAIKQIRAELASQPDFIRRFEAEARLVAGIEHPHIVPLIDFWRDPDSAYLVMRWMSGGTLERRLDDGWLSVDETLRLASQVGGALTVAHRQGVVHRDVKTANILFDDHGNAFLGDFGIAVREDGGGGAAAGLSLGTPAYAAPEQVRREPLGPQADVFSLGVVLFECLTGELPYGGLSPAEIVDQRMTRPLPSVREQRDGVPQHMAEAIATATALDPADRFGSVAGLVAALQDESVADTTSGEGLHLQGLLPNPYVGLRPFDDGDADRFFGRERLVGELADRLAGDGPTSRCVVVVGPSGSGKSSVVRAGLVPALRQGAVPGSEDWFVTTMVPGEDPFSALHGALLRVAVAPPSTLGHQLRDGPRGILRGVRHCAPSGQDQVLLVVDQFEEVFTSPGPELADAFLTALAIAVEDPQSPLRVVATVRADHFHRPLAHPAFAHLAKRGTVHVTPLAGDELERAITEPAHALGVRFEPGLVAHLAAQAAGRSGSLPHLQYALAELFEHRDGAVLTRAAHDAVGGLIGALASTAEALHQDADADEQAATRRLFGRLTQPGEDTTDLRRRVRLADLGDDAATAAVLERYSRARLLTFDHEAASREPTVEVAHEALLREWPRLVRWLDEDRDVLRRAAAVASVADGWEDAGRPPSDLLRGGRLEDAADLGATAPERLRPIDRALVDVSQEAAAAERERDAGRVRRLRRLVTGTAAALVVALVAAGVAVVQQRQATAAAADAEVATLISRSAALTGDNDDVALLLALEAHRRAPGRPTELAVLDALGGGTAAARTGTVPDFIPAGCPIAQEGPRSDVFHVVVDGRLTIVDGATGARRDVGSSPIPCPGWTTIRGGADVLVFEPEPGGRVWQGPVGEPLGEPYRVPPDLAVAYPPVVGDRLLLSGIRDDGGVALADVRTGALVGDRIDEGLFVWGGAVTLGNDATAAVSFEVRSEAGTTALLVQVDTDTGEVLTRTPTRLPLLNLAVDPTTGDVVGSQGSVGLVTVDEAGEVVREVGLDAETGVEPVRSLRVLADGTVVAATSAQAFEVDPTTGEVGDRADLDAAEALYVTPDGTVRVVTRDGALTSYELRANALAAARIDHALARTRFVAGRVGLVGVGNDLLEVIDLETRLRTQLDLELPDGTRLEPNNIAPLTDPADGVSVMLNISMDMSRWVEGEQVDRFPRHDDPTVVRPRGVEHADAWWSSLGVRDDGAQQVSVLSVDPEAPGVRFALELGADDEVAHAPTVEGGLHVVDLADGTLTTYDPRGTELGAVGTGFAEVHELEANPVTGQVLVSGRDAEGQNATLLVDAVSGTVEPLAIDQPVLSALFLEGTDLVLVGTGEDVRLWDVVADELAGVLWRDIDFFFDAFHDRESKTVWFALDVAVVEVPIEPTAWVERACEIVGRELTEEEWARWVPGEEPRTSACRRV